VSQSCIKDFRSEWLHGVMMSATFHVPTFKLCTPNAVYHSDRSPVTSHAQEGLNI
jgi:hypothetical protein